MGAIEFAKNKTNNREKLFLAKKHGKHMVSFFVSFLQVLCLSTPREVSASSTKNKTHNTKTNNARTHTHTLLKK